MTTHALQRQSPTLFPIETPVIPHELPLNGGALQPPTSASEHYRPLHVPRDLLSQMCEHYASSESATYAAFGFAPGAAADDGEMDATDADDTDTW